jgi:hypothetical protein
LIKDYDFEVDDPIKVRLIEFSAFGEIHLGFSKEINLKYK